MRVIQALKLVDKINLKEIGSVDKSYFSYSKSSDSDAKTINKAIEYNLGDIEELYEVYIKNKYTRIIKSKKIILTTRKL